MKYPPNCRVYPGESGTGAEFFCDHPHNQSSIKHNDFNSVGVTESCKWATASMGQFIRLYSLVAIKYGKAKSNCVGACIETINRLLRENRLNIIRVPGHPKNENGRVQSMYRRWRKSYYFTVASIRLSAVWNATPLTMQNYLQFITTLSFQLILLIIFFNNYTYYY